MKLKTYRCMSLAQASDALRTLRGRARSRTLDTEDLLQALAEARRGGYGLRAGPTVANCYGYPAARMRLIAICRQSGSYAVLADWGSAHKGISDCPLGGRRSVWQRQLAGARRRLDSNPWWILPGAAVNAALAARRLAKFHDAAQQWPLPAGSADIPLSRSDSLAAGNCPRETDRIAAWWPGATAVLASEIRNRILAEEPALLPYARRAYEAAIARMG